MNTITLKNPLDMHIHLREGEILQSVLPYSAKSFLGAVVMPNLKQPIFNAELAEQYLLAIRKLEPDFHPLMTIYLHDHLQIQELERMQEKGYKILKLYPKGATTNASYGASDVLSPQILQILQKAQELGMILSIHCESNGFSMQREYEFLPILEFLGKKFPKLKIILEHMSDHRSIKILEDFENIFATLTFHHMTMDLDDLLGKGIEPHHFCKPILKTPKDKEMLLDLGLHAHPKVSFGSDSAPHPLSHKLKNSGAAGIFSAPCLLERLVELFDQHHALPNLQKFLSDHAIKNYDLSFEHEKIITLEKKPSVIPDTILLSNDEIIPLDAGKELSWSISKS